MKKEIFNDYMTWLFDILQETEEKLDLKNYSVEERRVVGFLSERLFGIYFTHNKKNIKFYETQKTLFLNTTYKEELKPAFIDNMIPIVMAANENFVPYLYTFIYSIIERQNSRKNYDIIILHQNISKNSQNKFSKMISNLNNFRIRFYNVKEYMEGKDLFIDQHLSLETYFRLVIQDVLNDYHKILYLDCDMIVNADITELYDTKIDGYMIAATKDIDYVGSAKLFQEVKDYAMERLKMKNAYDYFQAGVLLINLDEFRKNYTVKDLLRIAESYNWKHHDQDVLNYVCRDKVFFLDQKWNVMINWEEGSRARIDILKNAPFELYENYLIARNNPYIVHYAGYQKPWIQPNCDFGEYFWYYARKTPYYEILLSKLIGNKNLEAEKVETAINKQIYAKVNGVDQEIYLDGLLIKFINKVNKIFPIGSKRRHIFRKLGGIIIK